MERKRKFKEIYQKESKDAILVANTIFAIMGQLSTINIILPIIAKIVLTAKLESFAKLVNH